MQGRVPQSTWMICFCFFIGCRADNVALFCNSSFAHHSFVSFNENRRNKLQSYVPPEVHDLWWALSSWPLKSVASGFLLRMIGGAKKAPFISSSSLPEPCRCRQKQRNPPTRSWWRRSPLPSALYRCTSLYFIVGSQCHWKQISLLDNHTQIETQNLGVNNIRIVPEGWKERQWSLLIKSWQQTTSRPRNAWYQERLWVYKWIGEPD